MFFFLKQSFQIWKYSLCCVLYFPLHLQKPTGKKNIFAIQENSRNNTRNKLPPLGENWIQKTDRPQMLIKKKIS